jgi:prevent-host-death family protein
MQTVVSATEARIHFGEVMQDAVRRQQPIVVEKAGKPQVVILAYERYQQLVNNEMNGESSSAQRCSSLSGAPCRLGIHSTGRFLAIR